MKPTGAFFVGVDPSSNLVGLAAFDEAGVLTTRVLNPADGLTTRERATPFRRLVWLCDQTAAWLRGLEDQGVWCAVVEQPSTRHGGATLMGAFGAVGMTVQRALPEVPVHALVPGMIDPLARVVKPLGMDRKTALRACASYLGYHGPSQDVCDAVVCAEAARELCRREFGTDSGVAA